jgi:S1-C subfamily serine protease
VKLPAITLLLALPVLSGCADDTDATAPIDATVTITATGCRNTLGQGIGTVIDTGLVLTAAHTLSGADEITVAHDEASTTGTIVAYDTEMDLALIAIDADVTTGATIALSTQPPTTDIAVDLTGTAVVTRDERLITVPVTIARRVIIDTEDVYGEGSTTRPGYELVADIKPGDSGALVVVDGEGIAVVWSRSRRTDDRAWAIDPVRGGDTIRDHLANGIDPGIDLERC